jgi:hypothetical protein
MFLGLLRDHRASCAMIAQRLRLPLFLPRLGA